MAQRLHNPETNFATTLSEWEIRLMKLCSACATASAGEEGIQLSSALDLLILAQDVSALEAILNHLPPRARFEALLDMSAMDSAATALMPECASYILSRSAQGDCLASVLLPELDEEMTSDAQTPALALISALAACLASVVGMDPGLAMGVLPSGQRESGNARSDDNHEDVAQLYAPGGNLLH